MTTRRARSGVARRPDDRPETPARRALPRAAARPIAAGETPDDVAQAGMWEECARGPLAGPAGMADAPPAELVRLLGQLRSAVGRYARGRREAGLPVERVLPQVKGLVREALALEGWLDPADALTAQVVRWTVMAYHDEPELAHVPRFH